MSTSCQLLLFISVLSLHLTLTFTSIESNRVSVLGSFLFQCYFKHLIRAKANRIRLGHYEDLGLFRLVASLGLCNQVRK